MKMEGPLRVKDSVAGTEEPVKLEALGAVSPPPNCSICLGKLVNTSFTDSCLHQFCFTCLLQWSKIKTECPLCKQTFKSIIHNVRSEEDYDQYHVPRELATLDLSFELGHPVDTAGHRFHYRTTMIGHHRRPHEVVLNPEQVARREQLPSIAPQVSSEERFRRRTNPANYRRTIYRHGIWATALPDAFGRFRECSADFYRREPRELNRLIPWLNRELQVLLNNNAPHVAYVLRIILDSLNQYDIRSSEFRDLVRPHFGSFTDHFVHELLNYAQTSFDLVGYDQSVIYLSQGLSNEYAPNVVSPTSSSNNSTASDDSDVQVLDEAIDLRMNTVLPSVGPHTIGAPGPSTVRQTFQLDMLYDVPDVLTISSDSSSSDNECQVIGYVKPRHERTPEIIELVSSDPEESNVSRVSNENAQSTTTAIYGDNTQPGTSHAVKNRCSYLSSSSSDSDSDSDANRRSRKYTTSRVRKLKKRTSNNKRRGRSVETRAPPRDRVSRNLSSSGESDSRRRGTGRNIPRVMKNKLSSSSDSASSHETDFKTADERKSSRTSRYSAKGTVLRVRKDLIKEENRYVYYDSFGSDSSSTVVRKSKRKYVASSSDFDTSTSEKVTRTTKNRTKQVSDTKDARGRGCRYSRDDRRRSVSTSSSASSYASRIEKRVNSKRRESQREESNDDDDDDDNDDDDDTNLINKNISRKERESKSKMKTIPSNSSSDSDQDRCGVVASSHSQCSNYSSKSYTRKKKSKHKERHKSKKRKRSSNRTLHNSSSRSQQLTMTRRRRHPL